MKKIIGLFFTCLVIILSLEVNAHEVFEQVQTLTPIIPGDTGEFGTGDNFGQVLFINEQFLFVGAPFAQPNQQFASGAVYVYKKNQGQWERIQIITTNGLLDHLSLLKIYAHDEWLFISAIGTPIGPLANTPAEQNFTGALLIYRFDKKAEQWVFHQSLDRTTPGLENLTPAAPGAIAVFPDLPLPGFPTEQGAAFGINFALHPSKKLLLVGAFMQANTDPRTGQLLINSGAVYAFKLKHGRWVLTQQITSPDGPTVDDTFGSQVVIDKNFALISNAAQLPPHPNFNTSVYVYEYAKGKWHFIQKVQGDQKGLTPVVSPALTGNLNPVGLADGFGISIAAEKGWVIVGAPYENLGSNQLKGAVYFFKFKKKNGQVQLVRRQKVVSDDPNSLIFGISTAIDDGIALIGDPVHTGPHGETAQGAVIVYKLKSLFKDIQHRSRWIKEAILFDDSGFAFESLGNGVAVKDKWIIGGTGNGTEAIFFDVFLIPPPLQIPLPVPQNRVIVWKKHSSHK